MWTEGKRLPAARGIRWLLAVMLLPGLAAADTALTSVETLFREPALAGTPPSAPAWSPDSRYIAFTWNADGRSQRGLWLASNDGRKVQRLDSKASRQSVRDFGWLDGNTLLSIRGEQLWVSNLALGRESLFLPLAAGAHTLTVSPAGDRAAFLNEGDLWLIDLAARSVTRLTELGIPGLSSLPAGRYSRPEREIGPGIWSGPSYAWSPDGKTIAIHVVDRRGMRRVPFPNYLAPETEPNLVRRGYPGDPNERRRVGLLDTDSGDIRYLELPAPEANQVIGFSWSPGGTLLVDTASDTAVDRRLYTVAPGSDVPQEIWHSRRPSRMYTSFAAAWHPDGRRVVLLSDRAERYGLYVIDPADPDGTPERLSDPAWDVLGAPGVVADDEAVFFAGNGVNPYEQHVYRVATDGGAPRRLTALAGQNRGYPSPDGRHLAFLHSSDTTPPELYVVGVDGGDAQRVTFSPLPSFEKLGLVAARYVSFPSRIDDYTLHARILEPAELDPDRQYPVIFGPVYSNTARNRWAGSYGLVQQLLVQKGYIVVQVDVRGSTGYGRAFREAFLLDFAGDDLEDLESAVRYMKTLPYVDPERIGIWGSSYGGTLTVYSLLKKPGLFQAGVAAAAAVDPQFFGTDDVAIVRRPDTHPEIFERKAIRYAANLDDRLLLIHGMQDHVVPFKTIAVLADALVREGKDFETAFLPGASHAWSREPHSNRYLFGRLVEFFDRHLGKPQE